MVWENRLADITFGSYGAMMSDHAHLPRLGDEHYRGYAYVHWVFTMRDRKAGWLDADFHADFREKLLHAFCRERAVCPIYCLMPDHAHLLLLGWSMACDQRLLVRFLRRQTNTTLRVRSGIQWQKQPYDNVLREGDRARSAFEKLAHYISENPVRADLVDTPEAWRFSGALIPGYPSLAFGTPAYWDSFWKIYLSDLPDDLRPAVDCRTT